MKIKTIFSFISKDKLPSELLDCGNSVDLIIKGNDIETKAFSNQIVYHIASLCVDYHSDENLQTDIDAFSESHWYSPRFNLIKTDDPNILILGNIRRYSVQGLVFEDFDRRWKSDVSTDIVRYFHNLMKKKLGHNEYKKGVCFIKHKWGYIEQIYYRTGFRYIYQVLKPGIEYNRRKHSYHYCIFYSLTRKYPDIFFSQVKDGINYYWFFWDNKKTNKIKEPEIIIMTEEEERIYLEDYEKSLLKGIEEDWKAEMEGNWENID